MVSCLGVRGVCSEGLGVGPIDLRAGWWWCMHEGAFTGFSANEIGPSGVIIRLALLGMGIDAGTVTGINIESRETIVIHRYCCIE